MNMKIYIPQDRLTFGKCKGETLQEIYQFNPRYIEWLIKYTDDFLIDLEDFRLSPIPTPYFVEKGTKICYGFNLKQIQSKKQHWF